MNRDDASTIGRKRNMRLRLRRPGSHVAYACAGAFVVRVNQPLRAIQIFLYLTLVLIAGVFILARESLF